MRDFLFSIRLSSLFLVPFLPVSFLAFRYDECVPFTCIFRRGLRHLYVCARAGDGLRTQPHALALQEPPGVCGCCFWAGKIKRSAAMSSRIPFPGFLPRTTPTRMSVILVMTMLSFAQKYLSNFSSSTPHPTPFFIFFTQAHAPLFRLNGPFAHPKAPHICGHELLRPIWQRPLFMNFAFTGNALFFGLQLFVLLLS